MNQFNYNCPIKDNSSYISPIFNTQGYDSVLMSINSSNSFQITYYWSFDADNWTHVLPTVDVKANEGFYTQYNNKAQYFKFTIFNNSGSDMTKLNLSIVFNTSLIVEKDITKSLSTLSATLLNNASLDDNNSTSSFDCRFIRNISVFGNCTSPGTSLIQEESLDNTNWYDSETYLLEAGKEFKFNADINSNWVRFKANGNHSGLTLLICGKTW